MSTIQSMVALPPGLQEQIESWPLGTAVISRIALSRRGVSTTLRAPADCLHIALQVLGRSALECNEQLCYLAAGRWTHWNTQHAQEMSIHPRSVRAKILLLQVPRRKTTDYVGEGECVVPQTNCVLTHTLRAFAATRARLDFAIAADVGALLCRVAECAIDEQRSAQRAASSIYAERLDRVRRYILNRLHDPHLSLDEIASHVGYGKRYIHKMFAACGERVGQFILRMRLQAAHCKLLSSHLANQPITQIALSHGFSNPSHFSEVYRHHFGMPPSAVRRANHTARRRRE